jgi:hypothetical protein
MDLCRARRESVAGEENRRGSEANAGKGNMPWLWNERGNAHTSAAQGGEDFQGVGTSFEVPMEEGSSNQI